MGKIAKEFERWLDEGEWFIDTVNELEDKIAGLEADVEFYRVELAKHEEPEAGE